MKMIVGAFAIVYLGTTAALLFLAWLEDRAEKRREKRERCRWELIDLTAGEAHCSCGARIDLDQPTLRFEQHLFEVHACGPIAEAASHGR